MKMKTTKNYEVNYCNMCQNGYRISRRIWWIRMFNHINTLTALLMNYLWSREHKWYRVSTFTHIPKDRNCDICLRTKITRSSCRRRAGTIVPRAENFGDSITADHKILSEGSESRNDHRYTVVVQDLATQWLRSYPCKTKTSQDTEKVYHDTNGLNHGPVWKTQSFLLNGIYMVILWQDYYGKGNSRKFF